MFIILIIGNIKVSLCVKLSWNYSLPDHKSVILRHSIVVVVLEGVEVLVVAVVVEVAAVVCTILGQLEIKGN